MKNKEIFAQKHNFFAKKILPLHREYILCLTNTNIFGNQSPLLAKVGDFSYLCSRINLYGL